MSKVEEFPILVEFSIPFPDEKSATIVMKSVSVDEELKSDRIKREMTVEGKDLKVKIAGKMAKEVRVVTSSLLDMIQITTKTLSVFS